MTSLFSSNLDAAEYIERDNILRIQFKSGDVYIYKGVPPVVAQGLFEAQSPGRYFNQMLKAYPSEKE